MALFRVLHVLSFDSGRVIEMGVVDSLEGVSSQIIAALLAKGRIAKVIAPPLRILPEWEEKAEALAPLGIERVDDLVSADLDEVAKELDTEIEDLREAVLDVQQWLEVS